MVTIDFTKPFLYKDVIYFNQGNLAANNILRCKLITDGDKTLEGYMATVTFKTLSHAEINETVNIVDAKNCIVDIKFPSNALEVGVNELEVILTKGDGIDKVVTPSPIIKYEVWQCITTGNGIQGDSNYPILIDLMSEVNNTVRIANNASATADASLKQTAKMLEVVNTNISKANEAIDNTNSAKDKALNAVEEVNLAKDNLISEVNTTKNTMIEDINSSKESILSDISATKQNVIADTNKAIDKMNKDFEALTASQQQDTEVINARDGEESLNARLERDLAKGKIHYETVEGSYISANDTLDSFAKNIAIKGNTIQNPDNLADIKSVGDKVEGQELYRIPIKCCGKNLFNKTLGDYNSGVDFGETKKVSFKVKPNTQYTCSTNCPKPKGTSMVFFNGGDSNTNGVWINQPRTATSDSSGNIYIAIRNKGYVDNSKLEDFFNGKYYIQLEEGTQATPYEPHQSHELNILSPTPLEKVGDVEDRIIEKDGVWGVEKVVDSIILDATKDWNFISETNSVWFPANHNAKVWSPSIKSIECKVDFDNSKNIVIIKEGITSLEGYKSLMPIKVIYQLAEPQFIPLPNSQQVKLRTFANQTNISFLTEIEGTIKADVSKSLGATVNSNTQEISDLWDFVLKNNLANFAVALNTLDTKLKLEQLTKTPR